MKKHIYGLLAVVALCGWPAQSQGLPDEKGNYEKLGVGNLECGVWTQARQTGDVYAVWWKTLILGWVQGFVSGFNLYSPDTIDINERSDAETIAGWVDTYCQEHPHDDIAGAAEAFLHKSKKKPLRTGSPPTSK